MLFDGGTKMKVKFTTDDNAEEIRNHMYINKYSREK